VPCGFEVSENELRAQLPWSFAMPGDYHLEVWYKQGGEWKRAESESTWLALTVKAFRWKVTFPKLEAHWVNGLAPGYYVNYAGKTPDNLPHSDKRPGDTYVYLTSSYCTEWVVVWDDLPDSGYGKTTGRIPIQWNQYGIAVADYQGDAPAFYYDGSAQSVKSALAVSTLLYRVRGDETKAMLQDLQKMADMATSTASTFGWYTTAFYTKLISEALGFLAGFFEDTDPPVFYGQNTLIWPVTTLQYLTSGDKPYFEGTLEGFSGPPGGEQLTAHYRVERLDPQ
jgi:hypothetical protein